MTLDDINQYWGWTGLHAIEILAENDLANLLMRAEDGGYWWLCPQDLRCQRVAQHRAAFEALSYNQRFLHHWYDLELANMARATLGPLAAGRKYCMTVPRGQGGEHQPENMSTAPLAALIRLSGEVAASFDEED